MKFSVLALTFGLFAFNSGVAADHNTTEVEYEYEILDELIALNATSLDDETAAALDIGLAECAEGAKNHGKFVSCAKKFLRKFDKETDLGDDFAVIKKAIAKSDIGKTATDLIEEVTGIDLDDNEVVALDKCQKKATSLVKYTKCVDKVLKRLVKKGGLKKNEAKKIKNAVTNNNEIGEEIEDEIEEDSEDEEDDVDEED